MLMHTAVDDDIFIDARPDRPGFATVTSGWPKRSRKEMTLSEAEWFRLNFLREKHGLEGLDELPPEEPFRRKVCRVCNDRPAMLRCSACRKGYCSKTCQKRDWKYHVFVCRVPDRPDILDRLQWFLKTYPVLKATLSEAKLLAWTFSDNELCCTFGFNHCLLPGNVDHLVLLCTYAMRQFGRSYVQQLIEQPYFLQSLRQRLLNDHICKPDEVRQALRWLSDPDIEKRFQDPVCQETYFHQEFALRLIQHLLKLPPNFASLVEFSVEEASLVRLYSRLCMPLMNIPTTLHREWFLFGFCYCRNEDQSEKLRQAYIHLAMTGVSLELIASHWTSQSLESLMTEQGVDVSSLTDQGIRFYPPGTSDIGAYRIICEVDHALAGRYCPCFRNFDPPETSTSFRSETHFSETTDTEYGFNGTEPWERWQLLNFYSHIFSLPSFDPREMQAAVNNPEGTKLDEYLNKLYPDFRMKLFSKYRTALMFPRFGRCVIRNDPTGCVLIVYEHVIHDMVQPIGLTNPVVLIAPVVCREIDAAEGTYVSVSMFAVGDT